MRSIAPKWWSAENDVKDHEKTISTLQVGERTNKRTAAEENCLIVCENYPGTSVSSIKIIQFLYDSG